MMSTIDGKKALPFTWRVLSKKDYSLYGIWLCELLLPFNSDINNLREMLMDGIRRSNSQTLAIGNGLSFKNRAFSYENEILTFDGNLSNNFQQLSGNPPNQAIFWYLDQLYKDISAYVGIDIQNVFWDPNQTAFQTEVQRESSQKRVNVRLTNRDLANERFADLYKDLLQKHFPKQDAEWLYPTIEVEDEELSGEGEKIRFRKKKWKSIFEVTPEILRGDIYIDVHTNTTAPTINAVDRKQKMEFLSAIWQMWESIAVAKQAGIDPETRLPIKDTMRDLAADYNIQPQVEAENEETREKARELRQKLQWMLSSEEWVDTEAPMKPEQTEAQPAQQGEQPLQSWPPNVWQMQASM